MHVEKNRRESPNTKAFVLSDVNVSGDDKNAGREHTGPETLGDTQGYNRPNWGGGCHRKFFVGHMYNMQFLT